MTTTGTARDQGRQDVTVAATTPDRRPSTILLRSSWQTSNLGDVAHAPGVLGTWQRAAPDARVILWPRAMGEREQAMLARAFPDVEVVDGDLDAHGVPSTPQLQRAWDEADLLVHGPAAAIVSVEIFSAWALTGRPYGYFGVSVDPTSPWPTGTLEQMTALVRVLAPGHLDPGLHGLLSGAAFVYCRDSLSLEYLRGQGVRAPVLDRGADATFTFDLADVAAAQETLRTHGLRPGGFVCVIPRTRYAPYHLLRGYPPSASELLRDALNVVHLDSDLGPLVEVITQVVREAGLRVLLCPEMTHAVELARDEVLPRLPADVRDRVSYIADFWQVDHATAVYERAMAVISMECHSPILAITRGTPTVYLRLPTETLKGAMFADLGLDSMTVEVDTDAAAAVLGELARYRRDGEISAQLRAAREAAVAALEVMAAHATGVADARRTD